MENIIPLSRNVREISSKYDYCHLLDYIENMAKSGMEIYANDLYFAKIFKCSVRTIQRWLNKLEKMCLLERIQKNGHRYIEIIKNKVRACVPKPIKAVKILKVAAMSNTAKPTPTLHLVQSQTSITPITESKREFILKELLEISKDFKIDADDIMEIFIDKHITDKPKKYQADWKKNLHTFWRWWKKYEKNLQPKTTNQPSSKFEEFKKSLIALFGERELAVYSLAGNLVGTLHTKTGSIQATINNKLITYNINSVLKWWSDETLLVEIAGKKLLPSEFTS